MFIVNVKLYDECNPLNICGDFEIEFSGIYVPAKNSFGMNPPEEDFIDIEEVKVINYPGELSLEELRRLDFYFENEYPGDIYNIVLSAVLKQYS